MEPFNINRGPNLGQPQAPAEKSDPSYQVMPQMNSSMEDLPEAPEPSSPNRRLMYLIAGGIAILIIGGLGYFLLGPKKQTNTDTQTAASKLPKVWMQQYFQKDVCDDDATCGDNADKDNDGLGNYDEFKAGTFPINPDSDNDGLADGDEVNIYKTDPMLKFTDRRDIVQQNNWLDSTQIKNGYDPLTPGIAFTETRKQQIADDTARFGLHEPTVTSLK